MTDWGSGRFSNFWEGQSQRSNPRHGLQHATGLVTGQPSSRRGMWTLTHGWHGGCLCFSVRPQRAGPRGQLPNRHAWNVSRGRGCVSRGRQPLAGEPGEGTRAEEGVPDSTLPALIAESDQYGLRAAWVPLSSVSPSFPSKSPHVSKAGAGDTPHPAGAQESLGQWHLRTPSDPMAVPFRATDRLMSNV